MAASTPRRSTATISDLGVLEKYLSGKSGAVLEAGSGTGQHVFISPGKTLASCVAERSQRGASDKHRGLARRCGLSNIRPPLRMILRHGTGFRQLMAPANCWRCFAPM